jgi:hypothetical protein
MGWFWVWLDWFLWGTPVPKIKGPVRVRGEWREPPAHIMPDPPPPPPPPPSEAPPTPEDEEEVTDEDYVIEPEPDGVRISMAVIGTIAVRPKQTRLYAVRWKPTVRPQDQPGWLWDKLNPDRPDWTFEVTAAGDLLLTHLTYWTEEGKTSNVFARQIAHPGDWIVQEVDEHLYVYSHEKFNQKYERL